MTNEGSGDELTIAVVPRDDDIDSKRSAKRATDVVALPCRSSLRDECRCHSEARSGDYWPILRRVVSTSPTVVRTSPKATNGAELLPVSGSEAVFFAVLTVAAVVVGTTVVTALVVGVDATTVVGVDVVLDSCGAAVGATGVPLTVAEAGESPALFVALIVTE